MIIKLHYSLHKVHVCSKVNNILVGVPPLSYSDISK